MGEWCKQNSPSLHVQKTKEMIVGFGTVCIDHTLLTIDGLVVERRILRTSTGTHCCHHSPKAAAAAAASPLFVTAEKPYHATTELPH